MIEIPLTQGKVALIDDEDWDLVSGYKWHASKVLNTYYARTRVKRADGLGQLEKHDDRRMQAHRDTRAKGRARQLVRGLPSEGVRRRRATVSGLRAQPQAVGRHDLQQAPDARVTRHERDLQDCRRFVLEPKA